MAETRRRQAALGVAFAALIGSAWPLAAAGGGEAEQQLLRSRYTLRGAQGPLGWTELTELRQADGSRSFVARERMEFWGPVLERFVVLSFDPQGHFDSGHWVGTSEYSADFRYSFRFDGRAIRGEWLGSVRGTGWSEVPAREGEPVLGFWGPLESLLLERFDRAGPDRQRFDAIDVEDSHHRRLSVEVERLGSEQLELPAGRFSGTRYRSERFGSTHHWLADDGTILRWSSEADAYHWELERPPADQPLEREGVVVARGAYQLSAADGSVLGSVPWSLRKGAAGGLWLESEESLEAREGRLEGRLSAEGRWIGASETTRWKRGEGQGPAELQQLESFFYPAAVYLLRFRDRAYPLLQRRPVASPDVAYHHVNHPITAAFWLRRVARSPGSEQPLPELAHIANRYRGGGLELQAARVVYRGPETVDGPAGPLPGHRFRLSYPGGWEDSTFDYWTDARLVPLRLEQSAGEGVVSYRLIRYELLDPSALPAAE